MTLCKFVQSGAKNELHWRKPTSTCAKLPVSPRKALRQVEMEGAKPENDGIKKANGAIAG
jgi:hypothetical protein